MPLVLEVVGGPSLTDDSRVSMPAGRVVRNLSRTMSLRADRSDGHA